MEGQIGILYQKGKQIGGLFDWSIHVNIAHAAKDKWIVRKLAQKQATALGYWLLAKPETDIFECRFYQYARGKLILLDTGIVKIKLPDTTTFNRKVLARLDIEWVEFKDDWNE